MAKLDLFDAIINYIKYLSAEKSSGDVVKSMVRASAVSNASLASRARLNVCQFPLLTSSTISVNTYQKTAEILEQLYAQYLKLVIVNQLEVINLEKDNKLSVVSKVHQNDNAMSTNLDDTRNNILRADASSRFESTELLNDIKNALPFLEVSNFSDYILKMANRELLKEYSENFNLTNLNNTQLSEATALDKEIRSKYDLLRDLEDRQRQLYKLIADKKEELYNSKSNATTKKAQLEKEIKHYEDQLKVVNSEIDQVQKIIKTLSNRKTVDDKERAYAKEQELAKEKRDRERAKEDRERTKEEERQEEAKEKERFRKAFGSVTDFDNAVIRKNNQLEPSILSFTMKYHTKSGSFEDTKVALAVKTVTHLVQSDELAFYINETLTKNKKVFRAIQVLTGEKEFSLRFLLHLDEAKRDARADSTASKWWRHLKDRRAASWYKAAKGGDPFVPNATIVMSYEDYEMIKLMYKKDLIKDTKLAWQLTDHLFLMHLVIVNDVNNELMIFNKDDRNWETYTLDKLQNEINTLNKMSSQQKSLR